MYPLILVYKLQLEAEFIIPMKLLLLLAFTALCLAANATTYYVAANGNDANNGTSPSTPWRTVNKLNSRSFSPGDIILFRRGDMWREQLNLVYSGAAGNPITYGAYGTGTDPIFNAADIITGWTHSSGNIWSIKNPNATPSRAMVIVDDVIYTEAVTMNELDATEEYFINSGTLYIWSATDPNKRKTEVSKRNYGIFGDAYKKVHHINFEHLQARYAGTAGLALYGMEGKQFPGYCIVDNCTFYANRQFGCVAYDGHSNDIFRNSKATYGGNGFYSWLSDDLTISNCSTANNIKHPKMPNFTDGHGYGAYRGDNWIVENCVSDNDDDAIHTDAGSTPSGAIIRYNKVFNAKPGSSGIGVGSLSAGATIKIYYNLIVNASGEGFSTYTENEGTIQFYNNTIYLDKNSGDAGLLYLIYGKNFDFRNNVFMRGGGTFKSLYGVINSGLPKSDYNLFHQADPAASPYKFFYNGAYYRSVKDWSAATGLDKNSIDADPKFKNVTSDWSLQAGSPCIDKGVDVGLTKDINGNPIIGAPDIGAFEFGGTTPEPNKAPVAKAGNDVTLTLPDNSTTLNGGTSSDGDGSIASYVWSRVNGPTTFSLAKPNEASTLLNNLVEGTYVFRLTVKDDDGSAASDEVKIVVNPEPAKPDSVAPEPDTPDPVTPEPVAPEPVTPEPDNPDPVTPDPVTPEPVAPDPVTPEPDNPDPVTPDPVTPEPDTPDPVTPEPNKAPVAKAGNDVTLTLPNNSTTLNGNASSDADGSIARYAWSRVSGPSTFSLAKPNEASTRLNNLVQGTYVFRLTVKDDDGSSASDEVKIVVNPVPNRAPVARAGADKEITLPLDSALLNGNSSTDPDGKIVSYAWSRQSGPSSFSLSKPASGTTIANELVEGTYVFRLTIKDDDGSSSTDDITITVNPKPNETPTANAGSDRIVILPSDSVMLDGSASDDPDGTLHFYNWERAGAAPGPEGSSTGPYFSLNSLNAGTYTFVLTVRDNKGASDTDTMHITVINKFQRFGTVALYPNPAHDVLNVVVNSDEQESVVFNIYDANGNKITSEIEREKTKGFYTTSINVADLAQGVYVLETITSMRNRILKKFIRM
jgi:hypothetical protein